MLICSNTIAINTTIPTPSISISILPFPSNTPIQSLTQVNPINITEGFNFLDFINNFNFTDYQLIELFEVLNISNCYKFKNESIIFDFSSCFDNFNLTNFNNFTELYMMFEKYNHTNFTKESFNISNTYSVSYSSSITSKATSSVSPSNTKTITSSLTPIQSRSTYPSESISSIFSDSVDYIKIDYYFLDFNITITGIDVDDILPLYNNIKNSIINTLNNENMNVSFNIIYEDNNVIGLLVNVNILFNDINKALETEQNVDILINNLNSSNNTFIYKCDINPVKYVKTDLQYNLISESNHPYIKTKTKYITDNIYFQVLMPIISVILLGAVLTFIKYLRIQKRNKIKVIKPTYKHNMINTYHEINVNPVFSTRNKVSFDPVKIT